MWEDKLIANGTMMDLRGTELTGIERIVIPKSVQHLMLGNTAQTNLASIVFPSELKHLAIENTKLSSMNGVRLPSRLQSLTFNGTGQTDLKGLIFPKGLQNLWLMDLELLHPANVKLPTGLQKLDAYKLQSKELNGLVLPKGLVELSLFKAQIEYLNGVVFSKSLKVLNLNHSKLVSLDGISLPDGLQELLLLGTDLINLDHAALPESLICLNLSDTDIASLDHVKLPAKLEELSLAGTKLTHLPESIRHLKQLNLLNLSHMKLTDLPDWMPELGLPFMRYPRKNSICLRGTFVNGVDMSIFSQSQKEILRWFSDRKCAGKQQSTFNNHNQAFQTEPERNSVVSKPSTHTKCNYRKAQDDLLADIVYYCEMLQDNIKIWDGTEDERTTYIRDLLKAGGYIALDQSRGGVSTGGERAGELDLDIRLEPHVRWTIFEALNLSGSSESRLKYWDAHLDKLLDNYNSTGCPFLFHVTYLSCPKYQFVKHCVAFEEHIRWYSPPKFSVTSEKVGFPLARMGLRHGQFLQVMECVYDCGGVTMTVYHYFVRIGG